MRQISTLQIALTALLAALGVASLASCGGPYEPCEAAKDCDPNSTDGCATVPGHKHPWCTVLCKVAEDCPPGPKGEVPRCIAVGAQQICAI